MGIRWVHVQVQWLCVRQSMLLWQGLTSKNTLKRNLNLPLQLMYGEFTEKVTISLHVFMTDVLVTFPYYLTADTIAGSQSIL